MLFDSDEKIVNVNERRPSSEDFMTYLEQKLNKPKEIILPGGMKMVPLRSKK